MGDGIRILVDYRERGCECCETLRHRPDVRLVETCLPAGDYVVESGVTIERKRLPDLLASLRDGRLFRQAARLKACTARPVLMIEKGGAPGPRRVRDALTSLAVLWYLPILWTADAAESTETIVRIGRQWLRDTRGFYLPPKRSRRRVDHRAVDLVRRLPGIGDTLALRLLEHFGSPAAVMAANPCELAQVRSVGRSKARSIRRFLDAPFRRASHDGRSVGS
jgi:ERCC4-type nuclease